MYKDTASDVKAVSAIARATVATATTTNGVSVDTTGFGGITFVLSVDTYANGTLTPIIEDSPDNSVWTAVPDAELIGTEAGAALVATGVKKIGYIGKEKWVRMNGVTTGGTVSVSFSGVGVLGYAEDSPVAQ